MITDRIVAIFLGTDGTDRILVPIVELNDLPGRYHYDVIDVGDDPKSWEVKSIGSLAWDGTHDLPPPFVRGLHAFRGMRWRRLR